MANNERNLMRAFDVIGALCLVGWIAVVGQIAFDQSSEHEVLQLSDEIVINDGESWMLLRGSSEDVGYVHETRRRVDDGWLVEYSMLMNVNVAGMRRSFSSNIRGRIDPDGNLRQVVADVDGGQKKFKIKAVVKQDHIQLTSDLGLLKEQKIPFKEPPRLATNVYRRLAALDAPTPGDVIEGTYFDPLTLGNKTMTFEFIEETDVTNNDTKVRARKFVQRVNGQELDVFVDFDGQVQIQEFPFKIVGHVVPPAFGASRAKALRKERPKEEGGGVNFGLSDAMEMIEGKSPESANRYLVTFGESTDIPQESLVSFRQSATATDHDRRYLVDTMANNDIPAPNESRQDAMKSQTAKIDFGRDVFQWVDAIASKENASVASRAREIAAQISTRMQAGSQVAVDTAAGALASKVGDCTEHALVLVAALRRARVPAHFVYGIKYVDGQAVPHQWVEYWDGRQFLELDATDPEQQVRENVIRLLVDLEPESDRWLGVLQDLTVTVADAPPSAEPSDFN